VSGAPKRPKGVTDVGRGCRHDATWPMCLSRETVPLDGGRRRSYELRARAIRVGGPWWAASERRNEAEAAARRPPGLT
jgi:hypothetical protein